MDDNSNIYYYIVLGIIYLLSRVFGKKKKKKEPASRPVEEQEIEAPTASKEVEPSLSFEDILREVSGESKTKPEPIPPPIPYSEAEVISIPETGIEPGPAYQSDEMEEIAVDYQVPPTLGSESLPEPDLISKKKRKNVYGRMESFKIHEKHTVDYLENFYEEDGAAKAFVLSEIFNRRY